MKLEVLHGQRIYLDSNALIYAIESDAARQPASVRALFDAFGHGRITAWASPLVRAEVLVMPTRMGNDRLVAIYRELLSEPGTIRMAPVGSAAADASAAMRAERPSLKLLDALHIALALAAGCAAIISADRRLRAAAEHRIAVVDFDELVA
jgi:predicted nucleic acid-binding protein